MSEEGPLCWACNGVDPDTCPVCTLENLPPPEPAPASEEEEEESAEEEQGPQGGGGGRATHGDAGEDTPLNPLMMQLVDNPRDYNLNLLVQAEGYLHCDDWGEAHELSNRCCRNLEMHIASCNGVGGAGSEQQCSAPPMLYRGEQELLCVAFAHRGRCFLLKQDYAQVIDDCKRFGRLCEAVVNGGDPEIMRKFEKDVIADYAPGSTFLGQLPIIGAAADIANQSRERVGNGWAPKLVLDHTQKAIDGLGPLDNKVYPGLNSLRAHLHVTRAHACLELEMWDAAKEDAELALACDARFTEAKYMYESAENEEW